MFFDSSIAQLSLSLTFSLQVQRELDYFQIPIEVRHDEYEYIGFNWEQAYGPGQCDYQYLYLISVEGSLKSSHPHNIIFIIILCFVLYSHTPQIAFTFI
jgi:hypothetical protein